VTQSPAQTIKDALRNLEPAEKKAAMVKLAEKDPQGWAAYLATLERVDPMEALNQA
jgi:hypothetical protein